MSDSLIPSFLKSDVSDSLRLLTKNELCERIAQVAHQKWAHERIPSPSNTQSCVQIANDDDNITVLTSVSDPDPGGKKA